jgi:tripartite-type tricarboxylate transporter receptor subunit TctC
MLWRIIFVLLALGGAAIPVTAQTYPSHAVTVVLPVPPGGSLDFVLRLIQGKFSDAVGQPLIIESRPGAAGNIGTTYVAKAPPDGYTLLATPTNIGILPHVFPNLSYDPIKDFAVVGSLAETPGVCVVSSSSRIKSFADLINEARANPGKINFGSSGAGTPSHLDAELIAKLNNVKMTHVPYKGAAPAIADIMGGFVDFICTALAGSVSALIQDGKLNAIAVTTEKRSKLLSDIPTVKELGFGDIDDSSRYVVLAPALTPKPDIDRISMALKSILRDPSLRDHYAKAGYEVSQTNPTEVAHQIKQQYDLWGPLIRELNLKLE